MSYSKWDAKAEFEGRVHDVLHTRDVEGAYELAHIYAEMGDDEQGWRFSKLAQKWEREDNYHDESNGN
jgi:hypothetical protein